MSWYLMFLLGALFGKVMVDSGAPDSGSKWIFDRLGMKYAVIAIVIACAIYWAVGATTVEVPALGTALAIILYSLGLGI